MNPLWPSFSSALKPAKASWSSPERLGTGKTTLLHKLLDWLKQRGRSSAYVFHAILEPVELLQFILRDFGVRCVSLQKGDLVAALHTWLVARNIAGDLPALILDEAQALPQQTLDELRLLLNLETPRGSRNSMKSSVCPRFANCASAS
jgi:type II secretory pathway predicted ATPase ExeA